MAASRRKKFQVILVFEIIIVIILAVFAFLLVKMNKINHHQVNNKKLNVNEIEGFTNIILFGVDARGKELKNSTRSDTMILVSINEKTKEISLTSFYRDFYAFSPEEAGSDKPIKLDHTEFDKLTHAYNKGPEASIKEINTNFDLDVTDFVTVNFFALVKVIDELGGIEIDIPNRRDLINDINKFGKEVADKHKAKYTPIVKSGLQTINGYQAIGYSRTRKKDSDFNRAQRQREVINKMFEKFKKTASISTANAVYNAVAENMTTSFKTTELIKLLADAPKYKIRKEIDSNYGNGFPYNAVEYLYKYYVNGKEQHISYQISKSFKDDVIRLHYNLFNNGVLPPEFTEAESTSSSSSDDANTNSDSPTSTPSGGNGYKYTPSGTVDLISRYHEACYNKTAN